ncbi:putative DNA helicase [Caulobacter virus Magneto]|uniref:putative DNA helicase n=1 Tax=Caulobacter virus Magneto TaxID=1211642 RepID=UPI00028B0EF7|nr:putative DNA helicase [Caulobacter virus Magneto]AFU87299.1 putative DNA helicase [Caulobacter virus Magneto]
MAFIDYRDGYFWAVTEWEDRKRFQEAGFTWSPPRRALITHNPAVALAVPGVVWKSNALDELGRREHLANISRALSYKADCDFWPPISKAVEAKGWDFKPFQRAGIDFATLPGRRDTLIADPPGLGKTIQAIGVSNAIKKIRRVLVVVPASLKENWRREWLLWCSKGLSVGIAETRYRETVRDGFYKNGKPRFKKVVHPRWWPKTDVVIINYDILERFSKEIHEQPWDLLVCDECHAIKTPDSGRTIFILGGEQMDARAKAAVRKKRKEANAAEIKKAEAENREPVLADIWFNPVDAKRRVFLSGTPMMNRPIEMWSIVKAFDPDGLGKSYNDFGYRYCDGWFDNTRGKHGAYNFTGASNLEELGYRLRSTFMVRRNKREVLPELPPKFRQIVLLDSPEIREVVAREDELSQALKLYEATVLAGENETEDQRDIRLGLSILETAQRYGFDKAVGQDGDPDKPNSRALNLDYAAAVLGLAPPAVAVLFEEIAAVRRELGMAKLPAIIPWVKNFLDGGDKLILFAYHSDVVKALAEALADYNPAMIYGGTPVNKRQLQVDKFQDDESCRVIVCNLQAAGVGFTMTRAHDVAFAEGDWTPTLIEQAEDRACRIGQTAEKIMCFFLVANGSLDARIAQAAKEKEDNIAKVMDT